MTLKSSKHAKGGGVSDRVGAICSLGTMLTLLRKFRFIPVSGQLLLLAGIVMIANARRKEPTYNGQTLSYWLQCRGKFAKAQPNTAELDESPKAILGSTPMQYPGR